MGGSKANVVAGREHGSAVPLYDPEGVRLRSNALAFKLFILILT